MAAAVDKEDALVSYQMMARKPNGYSWHFTSWGGDAMTTAYYCLQHKSDIDVN